jgi:hypothetical protein
MRGDNIYRLPSHYVAQKAHIKIIDRLALYALIIHSNM